MTEEEILKKISEYAEKAFPEDIDDFYGREADEDGEMFFEDGWFYIIVADQSRSYICRTYQVDEFVTLRYKSSTEFREGWIRFYFKNGDILEYCGPLASPDWVLNRHFKGQEIVIYYSERENAEN